MITLLLTLVVGMEEISEQGYSY